MAPWLMLVSSAIYGYSALEWLWRGDYAQFFMFGGYAVAGVALYYVSLRAL